MKVILLVVHNMNVYCGVGVQLHKFITSALDGG